jgi:hypothetical protein
MIRMTIMMVEIISLDDDDAGRADYYDNHVGRDDQVDDHTGKNEQDDKNDGR